MKCQPPRTAGELCEYVQGSKWISWSISRFAERVAPLRKLLEAIYTKADGSRKQKSIAKIPLSELGWHEFHKEAFANLQALLQETARLAHRDPNMLLCTHNDTADKNWAVAAAQCGSSKLDKALLELLHHPLAFLISAFTDRETHWSTYKCEAYAVVQAFRNFDYILSTDPTTRMFTDHRNVLFAFNAVAVKSSVARHKVLKVVRRALSLSAFNHRTEHVPRDCNTWPDIMTRWMRESRRIPAIRGTAPVTSFNRVPLSIADPDFTWPLASKVQDVQKEYRSEAPKCTSSSDETLIRIKRAAWIPSAAVNLKLGLLVIAHAGTAGQHGADLTRHTLRIEFTWTDHREDVRNFVSSCLSWLLSKSRKKLPRPLPNPCFKNEPGVAF